MKKITFVTLVMAFFIAILGSWCSAQTPVAVTDISKEGSLLIWPKIITTGTLDTYVAISNSWQSSVNIKCYWEMKDYVDTSLPAIRHGCLNTDFQFRLTANQPYVFSAKTGEGLWGGGGDVSGFGEGEGILKCWAVNSDATEQISWNYLKGEGIVVDLSGASTYSSAWEYNAYRFAAYNTAGRGKIVGTPAQQGMINLIGGGAGTYDACPSYIIFDFLADSANATSDLTLIPCKEDLRQEGQKTLTKATFTIWNENEVKFTGAHQCFGCFMEVALDYITIPQDSKSIKALKPFNISRLHTDAARMRVQGLASSNYCSGSVESPLLGLIDTQLTLGAGKYLDRAGTNASVAGKYINGPVYLQWDPGYESLERIKR
jgi:hypothetical protein